MNEKERDPKEEGPRSWLGLVMVAILFGALVLPRIFPPKSPLIGQKAPDFALPIVESSHTGDRIHLAELQGHPVVLDFWATWCEPCQVQAPLLDRIAKRYRDKGLSVVGINTSDRPGMAARFAERHKISYPIVFDDGEAVAGQYGVGGLPTLVVIDSQGTVVAVRSGLVSEETISRIVEPML